MKKILLILLFTIGSALLADRCFSQATGRSIAAPAVTPAAGYPYYYFKTGDKYCVKNSGASEFCIPTSAGRHRRARHAVE